MCVMMVCNYNIESHVSARRYRAVLNEYKYGGVCARARDACYTSFALGKVRAPGARARARLAWNCAFFACARAAQVGKYTGRCMPFDVLVRVRAIAKRVRECKVPFKMLFKLLSHPARRASAAFANWAESARVAVFRL